MIVPWSLTVTAKCSNPAGARHSAHHDDCMKPVALVVSRNSFQASQRCGSLSSGVTTFSSRSCPCPALSGGLPGKGNRLLQFPAATGRPDGHCVTFDPVQIDHTLLGTDCLPPD